MLNIDDIRAVKNNLMREHDAIYGEIPNRHKASNNRRRVLERLNRMTRNKTTQHIIERAIKENMFDGENAVVAALERIGMEVMR